MVFGRIPVVLENRRSSQWGRGGLRTPCTLPLYPPLSQADHKLAGVDRHIYFTCLLVLALTGILGTDNQSDTTEKV